MPQQQNPRWEKKGWGYKVTTPDDIMRAISRIGTLQIGRRYAWRGLSNFRYRIRSSLVRKLSNESREQLPDESSVRRRELALLREARLWGIEVEAGAHATDLHLLSLLQHQGVPTRLLDITSNPMTALWFACQRAKGAQDSSGALFAFDVTSVPEHQTIDPTAQTTWGSLENPLGWSLEHALTVSASNNQPFLVRPTLPDPRMRAQEGLFISGAVPSRGGVEGIDGFPLTSSVPPGNERLSSLLGAEGRGPGRPQALPFCALIIPPSLKRRLLPHLEGTYNRSYRALFPDIAGFKTAVDEGRIDLRWDEPLSPASEGPEETSGEH